MDRRAFLSRGAAAGGLVLVGAAGLAACSSSPSGTGGGSGGSGTPGVNKGTPKTGGSLTIGTTAEIDGFFPPNNHWDNNGFLYANAVYDPLTAVAADGTIKPYLAQSVTPNSTYTVWTLTLRPGITFHDGSALTATVVKNNFDALKASTLTGIALQQVKSATVTGPLTLVYTCTQPLVDFPAGLATQVGYVVGQAMLDAVKASSTASPKPIGTGPFVFGNWQPNQQFSATRNPNYWRSGLPYLNSITFKPIPDTTQREATLKTGGVDLIVSADPNTVNHFVGQSGFQVVDTLNYTVGEPDMDFIMLNCATAPTNDLRIRQALAKATDQAQVNKIFGGGLAKLSNGLFPKGSKYYSSTAYPTFDLPGAKALVAAYKAQHGTAALTLTGTTDPRVSKATQVLQQMWNQAGFDITIKAIEQAALITDAITGTYQALTFEQFAVPDPDLNYVWWSSTTVAAPGQISLNFARNSDPLIEQALQIGRTNPDPAARIKAYQTVNERICIDLPYIWLGQTVWSEVGDTRVQNFANPVLPDGSPGYPFQNGFFFPTQIWMAG
ncbi:MAG TPA: ABC transporter substrate-binding protein [Acidimicrobiales bacterium]|jgi:ABC-type transport system substrate-binding protein|nr:ABC transporter substrate-binding protein [Acidimicrobiales bacterium]